MNPSVTFERHYHALEKAEWRFNEKTGWTERSMNSLRLHWHRFWAVAALTFMDERHKNGNRRALNRQCHRLKLPLTTP